MRYLALFAAAVLASGVATARPGSTCGLPQGGEKVELACDDGSWVDGVRVAGAGGISGIAISCRKLGDTGATEWKSWGTLDGQEEGICPSGAALTGLKVAAMNGVSAAAGGVCAALDPAMGWWSGTVTSFDFAAVTQSSCQAKCGMGEAWQAVTLFVAEGRIVRLTPDCSNAKR